MMSILLRIHRLGPSTPGDQNDPGISSGSDGGGTDSGPAKPFLKRRSQRISMTRKCAAWTPCTTLGYR